MTETTRQLLLYIKQFFTYLAILHMQWYNL